MPNQHGVSRAAHVVAALLMLLLAVHFAITFLWNAPPSPVKQAVGTHVTDYMEPFFWQNWSLFAPNPVNADSEVFVRAEVLDRDSGEYETTEWESATRLEWKLVVGNPFPPRATRLSGNLYRRLSSGWDDLNADQQQVLTDDFFTMDDGWTQLSDALERVTDDEVTQSDIDTTVLADRVATAYATQFAKTRWGDDLTAVQVEIRRTPVPRWENRFDDFDPDSAFVRTFGWRQPVTFDAQDDKAFATYLEMLESS